MAYSHRAMQIRPGVTLLQAISKASEPRPAPFAERLADIKDVAGRIPTVPTPQSVTKPEDPKPFAVKPPEPAPSPQQIAARQAAGSKPRGSFVDIVV